MTDEEKHADCIKRTGFPCTFIPPNLYDDAERDGYNMRDYVKQRMLPLTPGPGVFVIEHPMPTSEQMRDAIKRDLAAGRPLGASHVPEPPDHLRYAGMGNHGRGRKHISEKTCSGKDSVCLPGLNGQCVACFEED